MCAALRIHNQPRIQANVHMQQYAQHTVFAMAVCLCLSILPSLISSILLFHLYASQV